MNERELYKAVGEIAEDLIMEASEPAVKVKRIRVWKIAAAAAALVMMLGASVWAAAAIISGSISVDKGTPDYVSVPSQKTMQDDIGIAPNIIEKFSNGYSFKEASIVNNKDVDENGNTVKDYKELSCLYYKGENTVSLYAYLSSSSDMPENYEIIDVFNGSEIKYKTYNVKVVSDDYRLSEQDKKDKESGKYVFSYGSKEIEIFNMQFVRWEYDGIDYMLMATDSELKKEELADMAKEMISAQAGGGR